MYIICIYLYKYILLYRICTISTLVSITPGLIVNQRFCSHFSHCFSLNPVGKPHAAGLDFAHAKPFNMKRLPISIFPCRGGKAPMNKLFIISECWQCWNQREFAHT